MITKQSVFLVVDSQEAMRKVTLEHLQAIGATTLLTASNGAEAFQILQNKPVDIVLSAWTMPFMTGLELLKAVRAREDLSHIPFIMVTAEAGRGRIEMAISCGVSDMLIKPYTSQYLAARVEKILSSPLRLNALLPSVPVAVDKTTTAPKPAQMRQTILVVDDTPDSLQLLSHLFKDEYRVLTANSGEKALSICQSNNPPDLVLLDIMMPGMDGFEVAQRLRQHPATETTPVIFVSAMNGEDVRLKGMNLGAVDFISKPIEPEILKPRVRNFLRYVELHKQLQTNYDDMQQAARMREDIEQLIRYDLKLPLAGMMDMIKKLASQQQIGPEQANVLSSIEDTAYQMMNMINLSSVMYQIENGRYTFNARQVNITDVLRRVIQRSKTAFAQKQLSIDMHVPFDKELPNALGDTMLCYSLFNNLIKNACEASPEKGRVSITLVDDSPLHINIQNKGAIPSVIRNHFFEKYTTHGKPGGSGLGTYTAKLLTEGQNGSIEFKVSDAENQTTVAVALPRSP